MRELIHIYGPFSIYSYGVAIAIALLTFIWLMQKHPRFKQLKLENHFTSIVLVGIIAGIIGGRLLEILSRPQLHFSWYYFFAFWEGGYSILGTIIAVIITVPLYLHTLHIPIIPFFDLVAIHAGILQSIARLGCLFAGCCFGIPSFVPWGICYTDPNTSAPLGIYMHPTQIYSSILLFGIFLLMYFVFQYRFKKPGQLSAIYLMLTSSERFLVDFWRAERIFAKIGFITLSINQWVAISIFITAGIAFIFFSYKK